jgi:hypothetical protein
MLAKNGRCGSALSERGTPHLCLRVARFAKTFAGSGKFVACETPMLHAKPNPKGRSMTFRAHHDRVLPAALCAA